MSPPDGLARGPGVGGLCAAALLAVLLAGLWVSAEDSGRPARTYTPLHAAARAGDLERVRRLVARARGGPDLRDGAGDTPLHGAAQAGRLDVVRFLLERGADPCAKDLLGQTPLHLAAASYDGDGYAVACLLLPHYPSADVADDYGRTPLHLAALRGDAKLARRLIEAGADVNADDDQGETPLHVAVVFEKAAVIDLLVRAGAH